MLGGTLALHHEPGGEQVETLAIDPRWLKRHLAVFFTGITHSSGMVNWQVIRRRFEGHRTTTSAFDEIAAAARDCRSALLVADEKMVGKAIRREWAARKLLAPEVCPAELEHLESTALGAGAAAFKACGAGGGGSVLVWHTDGARRKVLEALQTAAPDGTVLATGIAADGCTVTEI